MQTGSWSTALHPACWEDQAVINWSLLSELWRSVQYRVQCQWFEASHMKLSSFYQVYTNRVALVYKSPHLSVC
jgi:hypothetical protein